MDGWEYSFLQHSLVPFESLVISKKFAIIDEEYKYLPCNSYGGFYIFEMNPWGPGLKYQAKLLKVLLNMIKTCIS